MRPPCRKASFRFLGTAALLCLLGGLLATAAYASPTWTAPVEVSAETSAQPQVAIDGSGDAVAVWERWTGTDFVVEAASKPTNGSWTASEEISVATESAAEPQVAIDDNGDAVAVWYRWNGSNDIVQAAEKPAGGSWVAAVNLSKSGQEALDPQVAVNASGDAVAVWKRSNGSNEIVQAASRPAGGAWGAPADLSAAGEDSEEPQVAIDNGDDAVAVWTGGGGDKVEAASRPGGGAWKAATDLSGPAVANTAAYQAQVAIDSSGDAVAVWKRDDLITFEIQTVDMTPGGDWSAPVNLATATGGEEAEAAYVALDSAGDAVAVWLQDDSNSTVRTASKPAGGAWGMPSDLSAPGEDAFQASVSIDSDGDALAIWRRSNGTVPVVQVASKPAAGPWGGAVDLATMAPIPGTYYIYPEITLSSSGDAIAVWASSSEVVEAADLNQRYLTVSKSGSGSGVVSSAPAGIGCGAECIAAFTPNTDVTLSATAAGSSEFKGWSGACSGVGPCTVTMTTAKSVSAVFEAVPLPPPPPAPPKFKKSAPGGKIKAALKKCKKLNGSAKTRCVKRVRAKFGHSHHRT